MVLGTSIGGATALDFALNHPEDVAALVLIDAQVRPGKLNIVSYIHS